MKNYRLISDVDSAIRDTTEEAIVFLSENIGGGRECGRAFTLAVIARGTWGQVRVRYGGC